MLGARLGYDAERFEVIPHGVDDAAYREPLARPAARNGPIVGWLGSLSADRAWETAIDGFKSVLARFPEARLEIGGKGRARQFIAAHVRLQKLGAAVTFRGDVPASAVFTAIDMLVVPISRDAQPHAPLEALVAGVPLIAGNAGALADAVGPMRTGWLVDDDPDGFAAGIADAWERIDEAWHSRRLPRYSAVTTSREEFISSACR